MTAKKTPPPQHASPAKGAAKHAPKADDKHARKPAPPAKAPPKPAARPVAIAVRSSGAAAGIFMHPR